LIISQYWFFLFGILFYLCHFLSYIFGKFLISCLLIYLFSHLSLYYFFKIYEKLFSIILFLQYCIFS
jgi:hypothetical protein